MAVFVDVKCGQQIVMLLWYLQKVRYNILVTMYIEWQRWGNLFSDPYNFTCISYRTQIAHQSIEQWAWQWHHCIAFEKINTAMPLGQERNKIQSYGDIYYLMKRTKNNQNVNATVAFNLVSPNRWVTECLLWWSNRSIFRVTGLLCGEFPGHRWIPLTKASDAERSCFLWSAPEPTVGQMTETPVIWDAFALIMTSL